MSKARLVITAVVVEGRSQSEVARAYGVSQPWVSRLIARYRAEGEAAFEPRSRRPHSSPSATTPEVVELVLRLRKELSEQGLDAGPHTICWHLRQRHRVQLSPATVARYLTRTGLVTPEPAKRPKSSYIRFAAELPNECWQADFTHYRLADGTDTGHRRRDPHLPRRPRPLRADRHRAPAGHRTGRARRLPRRHGPARRPRLHLDRQRHGVHHPAVRRAGRPQRLRGRAAPPRRAAEELPAQPPHHLRKGGAVPADDEELAAHQPAQPATLDQLQTLLDTFVDSYNHHRPHRSLPHHATPATAYQARPKATPGNREPDTHDRVRTDRVDDSGVVTLRHHRRLHHIGIGRTHARTHVLLLVQDLHIRDVNAATGELLRELTLDPTRDYQPTGRPPGPTKHKTRTQ